MHKTCALYTVYHAVRHLCDVHASQVMKPAGVIDLTEEAELHKLKDNEPEAENESQAKFGPSDEQVTECHRCQHRKVFCSAADCLELYCKQCASTEKPPDLDFFACTSPGCCDPKQYCDNHKDALHHCSCCQKSTCKKHICAKCNKPACGKCLEDDACHNCQQSVAQSAQQHLYSLL